jgi:PAS domain S-box-containing protein
MSKKSQPTPPTPALAADAAESILESISDGVFTVDQEWRITFFNRAAERITGLSRRDAIGRRCFEVFRASLCEGDCALRKTFVTGRPVVNQTAFIVNAEGHRIPISLSTALLRDREGRVIGGAETFRDLSVVEELRRELQGRWQIGDFISRSPRLQPIVELLPTLATSDSTVLIHGETGTGKELLARAIHDLSPRRSRPFVAVHCGAIPDTLLESELFGYVRGAFTGALRNKPGRFALAEGGTLFLDEIGDVSPALQVRLLRVLQDRTYEPLGGTETCRADVRIIAATHRDLKEQVRQGRFREDLFYRLSVVPIEVPPLRERREDIPLLVQHFIGRFNRRYGRSITGVESDVLHLLMAHDFPGNVRELENIIERAFVLCRGDRIERSHLPPEIAGPPRLPEEEGTASLRLRKRTAEAQAIREALEACGYNRQAAARRLGLHRSTLFRKIKAFGLSLPARRRATPASSPVLPS